MTSVVRMRRHDTAIPWGFRMHGGLEYGMPLFVQKVSPNSIAFRSSLQPGDAILQIGQVPTQGMRHDQAKMEIIRSGNEVDFVVQREAVDVGQTDTVDGRTGISEESTQWQGISKKVEPQNPQVQSRSFKILQQSLLD